MSRKHAKISEQRRPPVSQERDVSRRRSHLSYLSVSRRGIGFLDGKNAQRHAPLFDRDDLVQDERLRQSRPGFDDVSYDAFLIGPANVFFSHCGRSSPFVFRPLAVSRERRGLTNRVFARRGFNRFRPGLE